jgi:hypothetical protein
VEKLQSQAQNSPRKSVGTAEQPSTAKRTRADEDTADDEDPDGYNTRYKGFKRVKVREEKGQTPKRTPRKSLNASADEGTPVKRGRGRPRKSIPEGMTTAPAVSDNAEKAGANEREASTAGANEGETSEAGAKNVEISEPAATNDGEPGKAEAQEGATSKRGRGRPRKSDPKPPRAKPKPKPEPAAPAVDAEGNPVKRGRGRPKKNADATAPPSKSKEVFDGVHLQKRKTDAKEESGAADGTADGEGEEEDAVLAAVNGGRGGLGDGASSLGGSNKGRPSIVFVNNKKSTNDHLQKMTQMKRSVTLPTSSSRPSMTPIWMQTATPMVKPNTRRRPLHLLQLPKRSAQLQGISSGLSMRNIMCGLVVPTNALSVCHVRLLLVLV